LFDIVKRVCIPQGTSRSRHSYRDGSYLCSSN